MKIYSFRISQDEIIVNHERIPRNKASWELRDLQSFIHICNDRCTEAGNRIQYIGTNRNGNLIHIVTCNKSHKDVFAEPLTSNFVNFLLEMILLCSFGSEEGLAPYKKQVFKDFFEERIS